MRATCSTTPVVALGEDVRQSGLYRGDDGVLPVLDGVGEADRLGYLCRRQRIGRGAPEWHGSRSEAHRRKVHESSSHSRYTVIQVAAMSSIGSTLRSLANRAARWSTDSRSAPHRIDLVVGFRDQLERVGGHDTCGSI